MSILRERMIEDMQLRGFSPRTQQSYARAVRKLADHYHKSPDLVTDEELRQYFLYRTNVSRWSRVACTIALCGIKFFYEQTLKRDWTTVGLAKPKRVKSLQTGTLAVSANCTIRRGPLIPTIVLTRQGSGLRTDFIRIDARRWRDTIAPFWVRSPGTNPHFAAWGSQTTFDRYARKYAHDASRTSLHRTPPKMET